MHIRETNIADGCRIGQPAIDRTQVARAGFGVRIGADKERVAYLGSIRSRDFHDQFKCPRRDGRGDRHSEDRQRLIRDIDYP